MNFKMKLKDMFGIAIGATLMSPVLGAIGSGMTGTVRGIGHATQNLVSVGFVSHAASKVKGKFFKF